MDNIDEVFGIFDGETQSDETEKEFDNQYLILLISGQNTVSRLNIFQKLFLCPGLLQFPK
jgi:hypothetical protein